MHARTASEPASVEVPARHEHFSSQGDASVSCPENENVSRQENANVSCLENKDVSGQENASVCHHPVALPLSPLIIEGAKKTKDCACWPKLNSPIYSM